VAQLLSQLWVQLRAQGLDEQQKLVRLIYAGKLLTPPTALVSAFNLTDGVYVHVVINDRPAESPRSSARNSGALRDLVQNFGAFFLGSRSGSDSEADRSGDRRGLGSRRSASSSSSGSASDVDLSSGAAHDATLLGLDILQNTHALEPAEVAALRSIFREDIASYAREMNLQYDPDAPARGDGQSHRVETAWVLRQGASSEFIANLPQRRLPAPAVAGRIPSTTVAANPARNLRVHAMPPAMRQARLGRHGAAAGAATLRPSTSARPPAREASSGTSSGGDDDAERNGGMFQSPSFMALLQRRIRGDRSGRDQYAAVGDTSAHGSDTGDIEEGGQRAQELAATGDAPEAGSGSRAWELDGNLPGSGEDGTVLQGIDEMGTTRDFLWGFVLGFSLGTLMLLCVFERSVNYRNKLGIIAGVLAQLALSISIQHSAV